MKKTFLPLLLFICSLSHAQKINTFFGIRMPNNTEESFKLFEKSVTEQFGTDSTIVKGLYVVTNIDMSQHLPKVNNIMLDLGNNYTEDKDVSLHNEVNLSIYDLHRIKDALSSIYKIDMRYTDVGDYFKAWYPTTVDSYYRGDIWILYIKSTHSLYIFFRNQGSEE